MSIMLAGLPQIAGKRRERCTAFLVALALCLPVPVHGQAPADLAARSYRPRSLAQNLIKSGVLLNLREFTDIPLAFRILDSNDNPAPGAGLVLEYPDSVARLRADQSGRVVIIFDSVALRRNPLLYPESAAYRIDLSMNISRGKSNIYHHINVVDLDSLHEIRAGDDMVWCPPGYDTIGAQLALYLPAARNLIRRITGFEPVRLGTVLSEKPLPLATSPGTIRLEGQDYLLFPYSLVDESPDAWFIGNLYGWVERTIRDNLPGADDQTRWVSAGIATYLEYRIVNELNPGSPLRRDLAERLRRQLELFLDALVASHPVNDALADLELGEWSLVFSGSNAWQPMPPAQFGEEQWVLKADLMKWHAVDPSHPVSENDQLQYQLAAWFWWDLTQRAGETVITDFLTRARATGARHNNEFLAILVDLTGGMRVRSRLRNFDLTELENATRGRMKEIR
jgi:hypothetical protein